MKTLFTCIFLLIVSLCISQTNFTKQAELLLSANRSFDSKDYRKALNLYKEANALSANFRKIDYIKAATAAAELKQKETCKTWVINSIVKAKTGKKTILTYSENSIYKTISQAIAENYDSYLKQFYENIENPMLYAQIQELLNRDQVTRKLDNYYLGISEKDQEKALDAYIKLQSPADSLLRKKYWAILYPNLDNVHKTFQDKAIVYADSLNASKTLEITKRYGWQEEMHLIIWHQRSSYGKSHWFWDAFKPLINEEIKQGKLPKYFFAIFEDFYAFRTTGQTIYGYYPGKVNGETVNDKRKSIGLPLLTDSEIKLRNESIGGGSVF